MTGNVPGWLTDRPFAHRGLHDGDRPENSLPAFVAAVEKGYGIELDVNLSADGIAMVFHDRSLKRMCGRGEKLSSLDASELGRCKLLQSDAVIPTLKEVFQLVAGRVPVLVELKGPGTPPHGLEQAVLAEMQAYDGPFTVLSFNPKELAWFARNAPHICRGMNIMDYGKYREGLPSLERFRRQNLIDHYGAMPDFIGVDHEHLPCGPAENARAEGKPIIAWTVRSEAERARIQPYTDNIIFEDFPA